MKANTQKLREHKEKELQNIIKKIQKLKIEKKAKRTEIKNLASVTAPGEGNSKTTNPTHHANPVDRYGKRLRKGQKVKLLTKGKFHCDVGVIKKIRNTTTVIRTPDKRDVWRLHHNIAITEE